MIVVVAVLPFASDSLTPIVCAPVVVKVAVALGVVPVSVAYLPLPSRSHLKSVIVPAASTEAEASNLTLWLVEAGFGEEESRAVIALTTTTVRVVVSSAPLLSFTLSTTLYVPGAAKLWVAFGTEPVSTVKPAPSKFQ